jgi:hypothetical protein
MARPKREGLDYFPLDVNAGIDDEIELVEAEYGLEGFAIFIKLLQKIYKTNYYIMWTEKEKLQFSKRVNVDINRVNVIIMSCLKWGLFNKSLYDTYKILTSKGIQKRFLLAIDRRTSYEFYREYLLLSENEVNAYKNLIIVNITADNADINLQIERERESKEKVKESKGEDIKAQENADAVSAKEKVYVKVLEYFSKKSGVPTFRLKPKDIQVAEELGVSIPLRIIISGIDEAFNRHKPKHDEDKIRSLSYCKPVILDIWELEKSTNGGTANGSAPRDIKQNRSKYKVKIDTDTPDLSRVDTSEFGEL